MKNWKILALLAIVSAAPAFAQHYRPAPACPPPLRCDTRPGYVWVPGLGWVVDRPSHRPAPRPCPPPAYHRPPAPPVGWCPPPPPPAYCPPAPCPPPRRGGRIVFERDDCGRRVVIVLPGGRYRD